MKKLFTCSYWVILSLIFLSCGGNDSYYEQFSNDKNFIARITDLNKTLDEIRASETGKLIKYDVNLLKYTYEIGNNDSYIVSYLFDKKGCFEIGIDGYFEMEDDTKNVVNGIKLAMKEAEYKTPEETDNLCRWINADSSISVELDYKNTSRGLFIATIFANE